MAKFKFNLSIGYANADQYDEIEIDDSEFEGKTESQKEDIVNQYLTDWADNYIETYYEEVEEDDEE